MSIAEVAPRKKLPADTAAQVGRLRERLTAVSAGAGLGLQLRVDEATVVPVAKLDSDTWSIAVEVSERELRDDGQRIIVALVKLKVAGWRWCPFDGEGMSEVRRGVEDGSSVDTNKASIGRVAEEFCDLVAAVCLVAQASVAERREFVESMARHWAKRLNEEAGACDGWWILAALWRAWVFAADETDGTVASLVSRIDAELGRNNRQECFRRLLFDFGFADSGGVSDVAEHLKVRSGWRRQSKSLAALLMPCLPHAGSAPVEWQPLNNPSDADFERLDDLYTARAETLACLFRSRKGRNSSKRQPVAWMGKAPVGSGHVPLGELRLAATRLMPASVGTNLRLYRKTVPIYERMTEPVHQPPNIAFILDSSDSMAWNPSDGSGPYDTLVRMVYASWRWLAQEGFGEGLQYAILNFSSRTIESPWVDWSELAVAKKILLQHQGKTTRFNTKALNKLIADAPGRFLAILVTDGTIAGDRKVFASAFKALIDAGHQAVYIQLGHEPNTVIEPLAEVGVEAYVVDSLEDLLSLAAQRVMTSYK